MGIPAVRADAQAEVRVAALVGATGVAANVPVFGYEDLDWLLVGGWSLLVGGWGLLVGR